MTTIDDLWWTIYSKAAAAVFCIVIGVSLLLLWRWAFAPSERKRDWLTICALCYSFLLGFTIFLTILESWPQILTKELSPGIYVDRNGGLVVSPAIPSGKELPVVYGPAAFDSTGFAKQGNKWYRVVFVSDPYDFRLAPGRDYVLYRDQNRILCANEGLKTASDLPVVTRHCQTDCWWKHDFPGKAQPEVELLVWPKNQPDKARIEKWVFDS